MTIKRFSLAIVVLAALIAGAADLFRRTPHPAVSHGDTVEAPAHTFIAETRGLADDIICPVAATTDSREIWNTDIPRCWLKSGWSPPQQWGSLAMGAESVFEIDLGKPRRRILKMRLQPDLNLDEFEQQSVTIRVNDQLLDERTIPFRWKSLRIPVPKRVLKQGKNSFTLLFRRGTSPRLAGTGKPHRRRAARISDLSLVNPPGRVDVTMATPPCVDIWNEERRAYVIDRAGTLVLPVFIPTGTSSVDFDLRATIGAASSARTTTVILEELDGAQTHRSEFEFSAGQSYHAAHVPVGHPYGRWAILSVVSTITTGNLEVSKIRFARETPAQVRRPPAATPVADGAGRRPDIALITLDAARADRFSFAGNRRETTPYIDELAEESLVFPSAFSLAPYTLCSVPTMLTGLSFLDHGVISHKDVLHSDAVTLAEALHAAGYQTAAFTQSPNNSSAKGFDQGYEVFREMWTEGVKSETRRASFIARKVVEWLDSGAGDERPLHLQVHIVPPHAPYDPPPEFDIFTDPGYSGTCRGYQRTLDGLDSGFMEPDPECMDQLFGLYDGNLLSADNAVKTIIEALKSRPRWNNTVVLVTSDHGEAFMEHGRMEHNSTLYTEMLHVPFVLRLPSGYDRTAIDTGRTVTLADIKPTLLGTAGLAPEPSQDGVDLLSPDPASDSRFSISRTATAPTLYGIRTRRWNLVVSASGSAALFDLDADPAETTNIRLENPAHYVALGRVLSTRLAMPARLTVAAETAEITEDEKELLEALGYLGD